jgi:hypothetical protein
LADALGFDSPDEFKEFATGLYQNTKATNSNGVIDQFLSKAPDFPVSNDNLVKAWAISWTQTGSHSL